MLLYSYTNKLPIFSQLETTWPDNRIEFLQLQDDWKMNTVLNDVWYPLYDIQEIVFSEYLDYNKRGNVISNIYAIKDNITGIINYNSLESKYSI